MLDYFRDYKLLGGTWRSEDMILLQLVIPDIAIRETIVRLGESGAAQFRDVKVFFNFSYPVQTHIPTRFGKEQKMWKLQDVGI